LLSLSGKGPTKSIAILLNGSSIKGGLTSGTLDILKDNSLDRIRCLVESGTHEQSYFVVETDVLYRVYKSQSGETIKQIVVPKRFRELILQIGHDIPFSGHLGNKTTQR
jgi:hypothetical protein